MGFNMHGEWATHERLDALGDPWQTLADAVDFEAFREILEERWRGEDATRPKGGRPAWDAVLMFKILLIGKKTGYSDERLEWAIVDSASLKRFLGIDHGDRVPDRTTIHRYRNALDENTMRELFDCFGDMLALAGYRAQEGQILDSTFVLTPIQRNTRDENATIKRGETPADWQEDKATAKRRQKDVDARWTKKRGKSHYGYKNHIAVDAVYKLIEAWIVTPANAHDVTVVEDLVSQTRAGEPLYADAAYRSRAMEEMLRQRRIASKVAFKRKPGEKLSSYKRRENKRRAPVRVRVEHVFGSQQNEIGGKRVRSIGLARASIQVGMQNLMYNMQRLVSLRRMAASC